MESISSLAAGIVAVLAPYLAKGAEEIAKGAGKAAAGKLGELHRVLKARLQKEPVANKALADLEAQPKKKSARAALERELTAQLSSDPAFEETLRGLFSEIRQDAGLRSFLTQIYGGSVGEIINVHTLEGGITINKRP